MEARFTSGSSGVRCPGGAVLLGVYESTGGSREGRESPPADVALAVESHWLRGASVTERGGFCGAGDVVSACFSGLVRDSFFS